MFQRTHVVRSLLLDEEFVGTHRVKSIAEGGGKRCFGQALPGVLSLCLLAAAAQQGAAAEGDVVQQTGSPTQAAVPTLDQLRPALPLAKDTPASALPAQPPLPRELGKPTDDITMDVTAYQVDEQAPEALKAALPALTAAFTGPGRSYEDLINAVSAVTRYLQRDMGLYLGYAYLPEQSPKDGVVRIAVLEGRLDEVQLNWRDDIPVDKAVIEAHLARLRSGDVLRVRDVERVVFLINDLRGLTARFEIKQGRYPGTATLVVTPVPEARVSGKAEFDSNGSRYSGLYRLGATANVASPLGRGDGVVLSGQATTTGGLLFALAGYTLPVGTDGLKIGASLSKVQYKLDLNDGADLGLNGDATAVSGYAIYPLVRSRNLNLFLQASAEQRDFIDRKDVDPSGVTDIDKRVQELRLGMAGDLRDNLLSGGVNTFEASLTRSRLSFNSTTGPTQFIPSRFMKLGVGFSRLQNVISNRLLAYLRYKGQFSNANLDTTERFSLGGPSGVRAFAPGEGSGDEGHLFTAELRLLPPEAWLGRVSREVVFSAFYDFGMVKYRRRPSVESLISVGIINGDNDASFSAVGLGAVWDRPGAFGLRMSLAWPVNGEATSDPVKRSPRVNATLTKYF